MTGETSSLSILAFIANEHRSLELKRQPTEFAYRQGAVPIKKRRIMLAALTMVSPPDTIVTPSAPSKEPVPTFATAGAGASTACSPKQYLEQLLQGISEKHIPQRFTRGAFVKPSDNESESYNVAANLVRTNDLAKLRDLHNQGKNLDACNRVGESLLHLACRRGHVGIVEFLMNEAKVRWDHQDDFGRTVLHDALWRPDPSIELMEALLKVVSPEWLLAQDIRGHTPFDYARREHAEAWYEFLVKHQDMIKHRLSLLR
jgi:Ankyrin repeats (3 copies)